MLPLASEKFPASPDELASALQRGLAARGVTAPSVAAEGATLAALVALRIDLTGAAFTRGFRVSSSPADEPAMARAGRLEITGEPLEFEGTPLRLRVEATDAEFRFAGQPGDGALVMAGASAGSLRLAVGLSALEALAHRLAWAAAAKQGLEIKQTKVELTPRGPRALSFRCTVTAKVFVMTADLSLHGNLDLDEHLTARLSGLTLGGDAMITKLAAGFAKPHLDKLEGRCFPLPLPGPGGLQLRDVEIATQDGLEIRAKFGTG